ncbi:MAG: hypothetical protein B6U69_03705 [Thermofilum sp. ex4484_15]|nr:MAG: hypothetical protein B6U69_03705 [Thermofilum sp. ex4484_15]
MKIKASVIGGRELRSLFRILGLKDAYSLGELHKALEGKADEYMLITVPHLADSVRSKALSHLPGVKVTVISIAPGEEGLPLKLASKALGIKVDVRRLIGVT